MTRIDEPLDGWLRVYRANDAFVILRDEISGATIAVPLRLVPMLLRTLAEIATDPK